MTIIHGVYCSYCHRRYAYHLCRNGMPCEHHLAELTDEGPRAPANLIECYSWSYSRGYQRFVLCKFRYSYEGNKLEKEIEKTFSASYVDEDMLIAKFLSFLKGLYPLEWLPWVEAFVSLIRGGQSASHLPKWRLKQLMEKAR